MYMCAWSLKDLNSNMHETDTCVHVYERGRKRFIREWQSRIFNRSFRKGAKREVRLLQISSDVIRTHSDVFLLSDVSLVTISSPAVRARFSRFNISLRRIPRLIYGFCRATASRVWVGVRIHKRVVLVMQIRERVGKRKRNRAERKMRRGEEYEGEKGGREK